VTEATDQDRYPTLGEAGRRMLAQLREHPCAPIYRNRSGNRLTHGDIAALRGFEQQVLAATPGWPRQGRPDWLDGFVRQVFAEVPHYRALGSPPRDFAQLPVISRADLSADITRFVPDSLPLDRLIQFSTTGTTGHPLLVPSHPQVAGRYLAFHKRALRRFGIEPRHGAGQVGVILLGHQRRCFTYVSVTPTMGESGLAKINLHPDDWHHPDDRARYLDAMAPEIVAGDPISFTELLRLPCRMRPRALMNVSMMLSSGLRAQLEQRFECPVLDIYSMNEVGPIAVFDAAAGGHVLLQDRLYVEILDRDGQPVPDGQRGEVVVSGGFNFCLPLLRYRTGDHAALKTGSAQTGSGSLPLSRGHVKLFAAGGSEPDPVWAEPVLLGLVGRAPVRFRHADGRWLNNVDVSHALDHLPLAHYGLHQQADGALVLRLQAEAMHHAAAARRSLHALLGDLPLTLQPIEEDDKIMQYSSDLETGSGSLPSAAKSVACPRDRGSEPDPVFNPVSGTAP